MIRRLLLAVVGCLIAGCAAPKAPPIDLDKEKEAVKSLINDFLEGYESRDLARISKLYTTSEGMLWFGTDSLEVIRSIPEMETQMKHDWELFAGSLSFDEPRNVSIEVGSSGDLASAVWEVQSHVKEGEKTSRMLFRFGAGLKKQDGQWRFFHGLAAVATVGQSSAELVAKMKAGKK